MANKPPKAPKQGLLERASVVLGAPAEGAILAELVVVGPYPTEIFIQRLKAKFRPQHTVIVVDDGWPTESLKKCADKVVRVRAAASSGLVHAKLYFFKWRARGPKNLYWWRLAVGSANASHQGFEMHAESLAVWDLNAIPDAQRDVVVAYFDDLVAANAVLATHVTLGTGQSLFLPRVEPASGVIASTLAAWLRRGVLCHKFESAGDFGKLTIKLRNPEKLRPGELERALLRFGFGEESKARSIQRRYIEVAEDDEPSPQWRARFFVETIFGFWTSRECYMANQNQFTLPGAEARRSVIDRIRSARESEIPCPSSQWSAWIDEFLDGVASVVEVLEANGLSVSEHFHIVNGRLDRGRYHRDLRQKLQKDCERANGPFAERFVAGFEFSTVPALGDDTFEQFEASWCTSVMTLQDASRASKQPPRSWLVKAVNLVVGDDFDDCDELAIDLRAAWRAKTAGPLERFHLK